MSSGLLDIITQAKNALNAFELAIQISTNNTSNMSTTGYKSLKKSFKTVFNEVVNAGFQDTNISNNPMQYGSGVSLANVSLDFTQGTLGEGGPLDAAVLGRGLFIVTPDGGKTLYYTRSGEFRADASGQYIVDASGRELLGVKAGSASASSLIPIKTDGNTDIGWAANGVLISDYTNYKAGKSSGTPLYQVALTDFPNAEGLQQYDGTSFTESLSSGTALPYGFAGTGTYGTVEPQQLEKSNVFYMGEAIDSIEIQRAMSAALTAIKIANDQISQVVNKLFG